MRQHTRALVMQGVVAGLLGYATVVLFYAVVNALAGRSIFYTAAVLGAALFEGTKDAGSVVVATGPVATYNMVHLLAFLVLGLFAVFVARETERFPALWVLAFLGLIAVGGSALLALAFFAAPLFGGAWWQVVAATLLAWGFMAWYLLWRHPQLRHELNKTELNANV